MGVREDVDLELGVILGEIDDLVGELARRQDAGVELWRAGSREHHVDDEGSEAGVLVEELDYPGTSPVLAEEDEGERLGEVVQGEVFHGGSFHTCVGPVFANGRESPAGRSDPALALPSENWCHFIAGGRVRASAIALRAR